MQADNFSDLSLPERPLPDPIDQSFASRSIRFTRSAISSPRTARCIGDWPAPVARNPAGFRMGKAETADRSACTTSRSGVGGEPRWHARLCSEAALTLSDAQLALAALQSLAGPGAPVGGKTLVGICRVHGLTDAVDVLGAWLDARA